MTPSRLQLSLLGLATIFCPLCLELPVGDSRSPLHSHFRPQAPDAALQVSLLHTVITLYACVHSPHVHTHSNTFAATDDVCVWRCRAHKEASLHNTTEGTLSACTHARMCRMLAPPAHRHFNSHMRTHTHCTTMHFAHTRATHRPHERAQHTCVNHCTTTHPHYGRITALLQLHYGRIMGCMETMAFAMA